jgi:flavin reductase (DIM6/NTAB) family NADH-FMN oxidoreductase RutF
MEIRPQDIDIAERYRILVGTIVPRPIALVSTLSPEGIANLAPYSFFTGVGSNPMTVLFCPTNLPGGAEKDTLRNAKPATEGGTGEFVVNVAIETYRHEMAAAAEPLPRDESEFDLTGLEKAASCVVAPPRVAASPAALECRTTRVVRLNPGKTSGGNVVFGEVVHIFLRDELVREKMRVDAGALGAIGRMEGPFYCRTTARFRMPRGREALEVARRWHEDPDRG